MPACFTLISDKMNTARFGPSFKKKDKSRKKLDPVHSIFRISRPSFARSNFLYLYGHFHTINFPLIRIVQRDFSVWNSNYISCLKCNFDLWFLPSLQLCFNESIAASLLSHQMVQKSLSFFNPSRNILPLSCSSSSCQMVGRDDGGTPEW